jgi:signal transduction histidine kinase/CheY-like chemotaxis protein
MNQSFSSTAMLTVWMKDIAPFGVFTTDGDLIIRSWNQWMVTHSGMEAEQVMGRPLFEVFPDLVERRLTERFTRAMAGEVSVLSTALHQYLLPMPASVIDVELKHMLQTARVAPLVVDGAIAGTITIIEDVTQREFQAGILRRQQELDRLQSSALAGLLQSSDPAKDLAEIYPTITPSLGLDAFINYAFDSGTQTFWLNAAGGISPKQRESLVSFTLQTADHLATGRYVTGIPATRDAHRQALMRIGLREVATFPLIVGDRVIGMTSFGRYEPTPIAPGDLVALARITGYASIAIDRASRERETLAASRAKDDFLAALSHELRTPLNPVLLIASDSAANPEYPAAAREAFRVIEKNAQLEARLIDDLLDLTRIEHGKLALELQRIDVHETMVDAIASIRADATERGLRLDVALKAESSVILGDSARLQQVFWNVLKNAIKFTPPGGRVEISSRFVPATNEVEIMVADTGIGLEPHELERVFGAFKQGDHADAGGGHRFGGLGLGLAISRKLVEMHAGRITASSAGRNQGAVFTVSLTLISASKPPFPVKTSSESTPANGQAEPSPRHVGRILLVEDHEPTRAPLTRLLVRRGYEVVAVGTATAAMQEAASSVFDVVLSDIGLPDGDGLTLMRNLRDAHGIVGVALTGYGMDEDVARSSDAGFVEHLTKPINVAVLDRTLLKALSLAKATGLRPQ